MAWNRDGQVQHFLLRPSPIILPAVTARVGRVWRPPPLGGFYERQAIGVGYFLDREALDGAGRRVSDAFRLVPGIAVECGFNPHACTLRFTRTRDSAWDGRCPIQYYVDGAPLRIESIDEMFGPDEIGGIEIYNAATVPARFKSARSARCGVIVIWTRR
ncbi:MAG: hypothetical protein GWN02_18020 [Gemmatimonadetes bacterium]|nr:hypothetical protein [Gemmatimonadota bacterium]